MQAFFTVVHESSCRQVDCCGLGGPNGRTTLQQEDSFLLLRGILDAVNVLGYGGSIKVSFPTYLNI